MKNLRIFIAGLGLVVASTVCAAPVAEESQAVNLVRTSIEKKHSNDIRAECLSFITDDKGNHFSVSVHEKHNAQCGGDPTTAPHLFTYLVDKADGTLKISDPIEGGYRDADTIIIAADTRFTSFRTPSGNINCLYLSDAEEKVDALTCQVTGSTAKPPLPKPQHCDLDWEGNFTLGPTGKADMVCAGDSVADPNSRVLKYGETIRGKGRQNKEWQCTSRPTGLICSNSSGHGFEISRSKQRLF